jgi:hypothetical protein
LSDRDGLLAVGIIASDTDIKETSDFTVIDNFDLLCEFRDDRVAGGDGDVADADIVDVDVHDDIPRM